MRSAVFVALSTLMFGVVPFAHAQSGMTGAATRLQQISKNFDIADRNHDGKLTRDEAEKSSGTKMIAEHFDAIDADHKGYVTKQDVGAFIQRGLTRGNEAPAHASS